VLNNPYLVITSRSILFVCNSGILQHPLLALASTSGSCFNLRSFCRLVVLHIYIWSTSSPFLEHPPSIRSLNSCSFCFRDLAPQLAFVRQGCALTLQKNKSEIRIIIGLLQSIFLLQIWFPCASIPAPFYLDLDKIHLLTLRSILP